MTETEFCNNIVNAFIECLEENGWVYYDESILDEDPYNSRCIGWLGILTKGEEKISYFGSYRTGAKNGVIQGYLDKYRGY